MDRLIEGAGGLRRVSAAHASRGSPLLTRHCGMLARAG